MGGRSSLTVHLMSQLREIHYQKNQYILENIKYRYNHIMKNKEIWGEVIFVTPHCLDTRDICEAVFFTFAGHFLKFFNVGVMVA